MQGAAGPRRGLSLEEELEWLAQGTEEIFPLEELEERLRRARTENRPLRVKLGIDPTATELHLGHVIPLLKMRQFQDLGHVGVLIVGDYTARIGDPSGRKAARPQLTPEEVEANARAYKEQILPLLDPARTEVVSNGQWFSAFDFGQVVALLGRMTVARMLEREDFARRLEERLPIGLHELVYPLLQGYDSVMVRADVELGGIDQKFNIAVGRDLQREFGQPPQVGVCNPVLLGTDGKEKMSKSLGNTINLHDPPEEKFGKVMSIPDDLMPMYFQLLTGLSPAELDSLQADLAAGRLHPAQAKRRLAFAIVARFHGEQAARSAREHFERVFVERELPQEMPTVELSASDLREGRIWVARLLVRAGLAASHSEARRLVAQGGVRLDGEAVTDPARDWPARDGAVLQVGRRRFARVRLPQ